MRVIGFSALAGIAVAGLSVVGVALAQAPAPVVPAPTAPQTGRAAVEARQALLKQYGAAVRPIGPMLRGEAPFQLDVVKASLTTINTNAKALPSLFPPDSNGVGDTKARPAIWERKGEFEAIWAKLESDSAAALAAITDEASFKARMPAVLGNCGTCHSQFRAQ